MSDSAYITPPCSQTQVHASWAFRPRGRGLPCGIPVSGSTEQRTWGQSIVRNASFVSGLLVPTAALGEQSALPAPSLDDCLLGRVGVTADHPDENGRGCLLRVAMARGWGCHTVFGRHPKAGGGEGASGGSDGGRGLGKLEEAHQR